VAVTIRQVVVDHIHHPEAEAQDPVAVEVQDPVVATDSK
jgi:hypothetical protein